MIIRDVNKMRKYDVNGINLTIDEIQMSESTILFCWSSDIGFGEYALFHNSETDEWAADNSV